MKSTFIALVPMMAISPFAAAGDQDVYITEFMYTGLFGEFIELTNTASAPVDLDGWVLSDSDSDFFSGSVLFSSSTVLGLHDTVIITEVSEAVFVQAWFTDAGHAIPAGLAAIAENNTTNLDRGDDIYIYEDGGLRVDLLMYSDLPGTAPFMKGPRSENVSAIPGPSAGLGDNLYMNWVLSAVGTGNAWKAGAPAPVPGPVGSPGQYPN
ncbi:MAG: lamin tail domain-containing protein [Verrucomicrobiaceae bacterium]|nr:MAG: lamin tail domain-containing protein [Verrucomicrobiaceae bacterium]